eukprot:scaffold1658_cov115-Isochrysis_galbana.AAC.18
MAEQSSCTTHTHSLSDGGEITISRRCTANCKQASQPNTRALPSEAFTTRVDVARPALASVEMQELRSPRPATRVPTSRPKYPPLLDRLALRLRPRTSLLALLVLQAAAGFCLAGPVVPSPRSDAAGEPPPPARRRLINRRVCCRTPAIAQAAERRRRRAPGQRLTASGRRLFPPGLRRRLRGIEVEPLLRDPLVRSAFRWRTCTVNGV